MIATPILYTEIITDDPILLLRGALKGPLGFSPSAMSKHRLLRHCRHLHLETHRKIMHDDPPSEHIRDLTRSHKRIMARLADTFRSATESGGFPLLFPNLETLTISAYTGARRSGYTTTWRETTSPLALREAWMGLLDTANAAVRCNTASRQYPLHGHQLPRLMINHLISEPDVLMVDGSGSKQISTATRPVQYFHADSIGQTWLIWYNIPVVYLYTLRHDETPLKPAEMMLRLGKRAHELLIHARPHGRMDPTFERQLDIDIRISLDDLDLTGVAMEMQEAMVRCEMGRAMDAVSEWYNGTGYLMDGMTWRLWQPCDRWTARVVPGPLHCPACQAPDVGGPGSVERCEKELVISFISGEGR